MQTLCPIHKPISIQIRTDFRWKRVRWWPEKTLWSVQVEKSKQYPKIETAQKNETRLTINGRSRRWLMVQGWWQRSKTRWFHLIFLNIYILHMFPYDIQINGLSRTVWGSRRESNFSGTNFILILNAGILGISIKSQIWHQWQWAFLASKLLRWNLLSVHPFLLKLFPPLHLIGWSSDQYWLNRLWITRTIPC